jgi:MFS transporter, DHA1 family, multidrug resistance protein
MMALFALSIDLVLPALPLIANEMAVAQANDQQQVVSLLILGMCIGQIFYGPLSDSLGRKPAIALGLALYAAGSVIAIASSQFAQLLVGRFLQGLGAAGPRIVTLALVRDQYSGAAMARIMSVVISVLMVGPLIAPFLGQGILLIATWRFGFVALLVLDVAILGWLVLRQPETLPRARRVPISWTALRAAFAEVAASRVPLGYTAAAGIAFGELFAYVSSAPQIFGDIYAVGTWFPACFAISGVAIALATFVNSRVVEHLGMRRLCTRASAGQAALSALFLVGALITGGTPPLPVTLAFLAGAFFCVGILFGNVNALAMEPLGHIAGLAAGVIGSLSWLIAVGLAVLIGRFFDGTVVPLATGFAVLGGILFALLRWLESSNEAVVPHP